MKHLSLPSGVLVPVLGQGTWYMGEQDHRKQQEVDALKLGLDLGMTLIDTAEMYAEGGAELVVADAIEGRRTEVFLVTKVYPHNADFHGIQQACERSLRRLRTDYIDLYLLHWPGAVPLEETIKGFEALKQAGKIRDYGVSNFDIDGMKQLERLAPDQAIATDQVLYNLSRRGIEFDLLPWCRERGMPVMAYSPLESVGREQKAMLNNPTLQAIAASHKVKPAQVALAWVLRQDGVLAIPKAADPVHVRVNRAAADLVLTPENLAALDKVFPPPRKARPLDMR
ncbi:aldo/keto reductase [Oxalobacteraceae bacterium A2-2]